MSTMWEVDPQTRAKLLQYSKLNGNDRCCDCGAPSPQWASPKFGTFICLNCAGTHRGLGVHISFVRSITMDAFKNAEILRMEHGGNEPWKSFFDAHAITQSEGRTFEDSTIKERYEGDVGEEWKERLSAKAEGKEYVPGQRPKKTTAVDQQQQQAPLSRSSTPLTLNHNANNNGPGRGSPASLPGSTSAGLDGGFSKKERNEAYFARMGLDNATRSESLPPSQGGKFTGFGGGLPPPSSSAGSRSQGATSSPGSQFNVPGLDDFQKDPMASLTKGFGWFTTAVGKGAKTMNDTYIQPTAKTIAASDFAAQARQHATQFGQNMQTGARGAADHFNRFVEGSDEAAAAQARRRQQQQQQQIDPDRRDFWDDFSDMGAEHRRNPSAGRSGGANASAIGTAAMRANPASATSTSGSASASAAATPGTGTGTTGAGAGTTKSGAAAPVGGAKGKDEGGGGAWDDDW